MHNIDRNKLYRIIDANYNRAKEGFRVCEDVCRFVLNNEKLTKEFKLIRHKLTGTVSSLKIVDIIESRDIKGDVGKKSSRSELRRKKITDILFANIQRVKESVRVLEEFTKLINKKLADQLKTIRYKIYAIEKKIIKQF